MDSEDELRVFRAKRPRHTCTPALKHKSALQPVADLRIGDGKKVAAFLRRCAPGRDMTCRGSLRDGGDEEERIGPCQYDYETTPGLDELECRAF
jgi:hypothetical protein